MSGKKEFWGFSGKYLAKGNSRLNLTEMLFKRSILYSRPVILSIEPTNRCNSNCIMCRHPEHRKQNTLNFGDMNWDTFMATRPFWKFAKEIILCGNGEPFLHPQYVKMAKKLKEENCYIYAFSNGLLINREIAKELVQMHYDRICISLGGATASTNAKIRGVDGFDTVINNIKQLQDIKNTYNLNKPEVHFNIALMMSVLDELDGIIEIASELGVDSISCFHFTVFFDHLRHESLWRNKEYAIQKMVKAKALAEKLKVKLSLPSFDENQTHSCHHPFKQFWVKWSGKVTCCSNNRFLFGDVNHQNLNEIWNSKDWIRIRENIYKNGYKDLCSHCPEWQNNKERLFVNPPNLTDDFT